MRKNKPRFRFDNEALLRRRLELGLSQGQVAEKIRKRFGAKEKVTQATVCHVEQGVNQSPGTVKKVADVLGLDMEKLVIPDDERERVEAAS